MGALRSFPGGQLTGLEADISPPSSTGVKNEYSYTPRPLYVLWLVQGRPFPYLHLLTSPKDRVPLPVFERVGLSIGRGSKYLGSENMYHSGRLDGKIIRS